MDKGHPLQAIHGQWIGEFQIKITLGPIPSRQGWTHFSLSLQDRRGRISSQKDSGGGYLPGPVLEGIHSLGGRGVRGWIEVGDYFPVVHFEGLEDPQKTLVFSDDQMDQRIFNLLSETVPPGGHLMFVYEVSYESPLHLETQESLFRRIPPVSTGQGEILFQSGFRLVKDWYLAEGGHEGLKKLWGEKPPNEKESWRFDRMTFFQLLAFFCQRPNPGFLRLEAKARERALRVMGELKLEPTLSVLREKIIRIYGDRSRGRTMEEAAHQSCQLIETFRASPFGDDLIKEELSRISGEWWKRFSH